MPSLKDLCDRRCVKDLIHVIEQVPARVAVRLPIGLDDASLAMVVFWTLLRWERRFWIVCLEKLGVDIWALSRELDALLERKQSGPQSRLLRVDELHGARSIAFCQQIDRFLNPLLDRAGREAAALGHGYLGNEHLLLAILSPTDGPLASLLLRHEIHYLDVKQAIAAATSHLVPVEVVEEAKPAALPRKPWGAAWDVEAAGVPRRFSLAAVFLMMTLYAIIFATMQSLDADPTVFAVIAILVTGVAVGQSLLFQAKYPRAASIWVGALLFPVEILVVVIGYNVSAPSASPRIDALSGILCLMGGCVPTGAFLGYLSGGLTAGVFLILEIYAKRMQTKRRNSPEEPAAGRDLGVRQGKP